MTLTKESLWTPRSVHKDLRTSLSGNVAQSAGLIAAASSGLKFIFGSRLQFTARSRAESNKIWGLHLRNLQRIATWFHELCSLANADALKYTCIVKLDKAAIDPVSDEKQHVPRREYVTTPRCWAKSSWGTCTTPCSNFVTRVFKRPRIKTGLRN